MLSSTLFFCRCGFRILAGGEPGPETKIPWRVRTPNFPPKCTSDATRIRGKRQNARFHLGGGRGTCSQIFQKNACFKFYGQKGIRRNPPQGLFTTEPQMSERIPFAEKSPYQVAVMAWCQWRELLLPGWGPDADLRLLQVSSVVSETYTVLPTVYCNFYPRQNKTDFVATKLVLAESSSTIPSKQLVCAKVNWPRQSSQNRKAKSGHWTFWRICRDIDKKVTTCVSSSLFRQSCFRSAFWQHVSSQISCRIVFHFFFALVTFQVTSHLVAKSRQTERTELYDGTTETFRLVQCRNWQLDSYFNVEKILLSRHKE